jgi:hypothetical protein
MNRKYFPAVLAWVIPLLVIVYGMSCKDGNGSGKVKNFVYEKFRDSIRRSAKDSITDTTNVFDNTAFNPGKDSVDSLLIKLDTLWRRDSALMAKFDTMVKRLKNQQAFTAEEKASIKSNLAALDSFLLMKNEEPISVCSEKDCVLFAEVDKTKQTLYLYIEGELKDSFPVSTGMKGYETPAMSLKPRGPAIAKYTSRKYPGGNYKGLGNMPYAVFIRSGYAIHGTTPGNFSKLGRRASHGCIRLHPDNAIIFYELVKLVGLQNTWVTVKN